MEGKQAFRDIADGFLQTEKCWEKDDTRIDGPMPVRQNNITTINMTPEEIAYKYVHGDNDAHSMSEIIDMTKDIRDYARKEAEDFAIFNIQEFLTPLLPAFKLSHQELWDKFNEWKIKDDRK